jgi:hypothetical protein
MRALLGDNEIEFGGPAQVFIQLGADRQDLRQEVP